MKNLKKKAFTLVELLVVIAIIAILAVAGVVGYVVFTKKAQQSNDTSLVSQLNEYMAAASTTDNINNVSDARNILIEDGIDLASLKLAAKGYRAAFDIANKRFVKINKDTPEDYSGKAEDLFVFVSNAADAASFTNKGYSVYLQNGFDATSLNVQSGVDVGENSGITAINYTSSDDKEVIIRTNSQFTTINISAPNGDAIHYGNANKINITAIKMGTYKEYGSIAKINLKTGKIEITSDAIVGEIAIDKAATSSTVAVVSDGMIFGTSVIEYSNTYEHTTVTENIPEAVTNIVTAIDETDASDTIKVGTAEALINLAWAQSTGIFGNDSLSIEITSNIDLTGKTWVPFGAEREGDSLYPFNGTIDGKGNKIIGLDNGDYKGKITENNNTSTVGDLYGFIAKVTGDVLVKNITFADTNINSDTSKVCAAVIADTKDATTVKLYKVNVTGTIKGIDKVAGLIGYAQSSSVLIQNCSVNATIEATKEADNDRAGGLIGYIGDYGIVSVYDTSVSGEIKGSRAEGMYGAIAGGLTACNKGVGVGLKVEGFSTTSSVQNPQAGKITTSTNGQILIGVNSCEGTSSSVDLANSFTFEKMPDAHTFIAKITA